MLQEIYISNFILIDELRMEFSAGLNVLTGETGAGKSIIIDALGLLMGERIKNDYVRDAERKAVVEAVFDLTGNRAATLFLQEQDLFEDETGSVILTREIHPGGRNSARIDGRNVPVSILKTLSTYLVDMHLQTDRQNILKPANYLDYIDSFATELGDLLPSVASVYSQYLAKSKQMEELRQNNKSRAQRLDYLNYQINEIEQSKLVPGEDEELKEQRDRIKNAGRLLAGSNTILAHLYSSEDQPSAYDQLAAALDVVVDLKQDSFFAGLEEPLENIYYTLQELSRSISGFQSTLEFEPGYLDEIENRLYLIGKLKQKYGENIDDILAYLAAAQRERADLQQSDERLIILTEELEVLWDKYKEMADTIHQHRVLAAHSLEKKVYDELKDLNMPALKFRADVNLKEKPTPRGMDEIEFLFSPNAGEELKPVTRTASGGEISRFILALKKALADVYNIPTLIFDEIDVGLGGSALKAVAEKLAELSLRHQLILVTHSPQVASYAAQSFVVEKSVQDDRTFTSIVSLDKEGKVREIARMLGGENYSDLTLRHAREMIETSERIASRGF